MRDSSAGADKKAFRRNIENVIVGEKNKISQRMYTFLLTHGYTLMWSAEAGNIASDSVYVREK